MVDISPAILIKGPILSSIIPLTLLSTAPPPPTFHGNADSSIEPAVYE